MKRLTPATLTLIMFGVVGLLVAAYIAKSLLAVEKKEPVIATRNLPMPVADIQPGTLITETHVGQGPMRVSELRSDMLLNNRVIVGRVAKELLKAATPIRAAQLYEPDARPELELEPGMRAVTIDVRGASSIVDGLIQPGQYCDLHLTVTELQDDRYQGGLTLTLFKGVRILAINRYTRQGKVERDSNSITLELSPNQASIIALAEKRGAINLTYNPNGKGTGGIEVANSDRITLNEILGIEPKPAPVPPPAPFTVQVYRGVNRSELQFLENNRVREQPNGSTRMTAPNAAPPANPGPPAQPVAPAAPPALDPGTTFNRPIDPSAPPSSSLDIFPPATNSAPAGQQFPQL